MKRALLAFPLALIAAYAAWCRTEEGRLCGRMVRTELRHYSPVREAERITKTSHA